MAGLMRLLKRPLWREDARTRAARRLRHVLVTPVMVLAGVIWGALASPAAAETLGWVVGGALGFSLAAYLYLRLEPAVMKVGTDLFGERGWMTGIVWDWAIVGGVAYGLTDVLGMPTFGAVTSAVAIGGTYALALAWFFDDGGTRVLSGFMSGGWGRPRIPFSHIETMVARNDYDEALAALDQHVHQHPRDARGWLTLGRLLDRHRDDPDAAIRALEEGLDVARLTPEQEHRYLFEIVRICDSCDAGERAVPHLRRFVGDHGGSMLGEWARTQLRRIEG